MSEIDDLKAEVKDLKVQVAALKEDIRQREVSQLKWGIGALGVVVMTLGTYIWSQIGHTFDMRGRP